MAIALRDVAAPNADCPLDLSDWVPADIIRRLDEAHQWAKGEPFPTRIFYDRGWFVLYPTFPQVRYRRKAVAAMIWRLESLRPKIEEAVLD